METVNITTALIKPSTGRIYQAGRIKPVNKICDFFGGKLSLSFVERYPCDDGRMIIQCPDHIPDIVNVFLTAEYICAGEQAGVEVFYWNAHPV